jgi:hypothetical protein
MHAVCSVAPCVCLFFCIGGLYCEPQALEFRTPRFPHLVPPAIMVWIFIWKYIFEPFIHILQHFVLQLSRSTNFCFWVQLPYYLYIHERVVTLSVCYVFLCIFSHNQFFSLFVCAYTPFFILLIIYCLACHTSLCA